MKTEQVRYALKNIMSRKRRSLLTTLSIVIGMMAVFALVSFGLGIQRYVDVLQSEAGADKIFVSAAGMGVPGTSATFFLTKSDIDFIEKIHGVKEIAGVYLRPGEIR
jgi:ABC-type antimicrobial peptide transport system permease subunit